MYLLFLEKSCEEICNSENFVEFATTWSYRRLRNIYIQHNLFHRIELGRDVSSKTRILFSSNLHLM